MAGLDDIFAPLLLGTWMASILFGLALGEAWTYFGSFQNDPWSRKGFVILTLVFNVVALIGDYAETYLPLVSFWEDSEAITKTYWPLPVYSIPNTILAIIVDFFLVYRLYSLSKQLWVAIFLCAVLAVAFAGYLIGFIPLMRGSGSISDRDNAKLGATINFIAMAVCDILTAAGLVWKLRTMRSNFSHTNSFIKRVIVGALQTGTATCICSILLLVTFLNNPESNVATFFIFQFAPLYSLTLLLNFNIRRTSGLSGSRTSDSRGEPTNNILMNGIQVHRTAIVTMDPTDSELEAGRQRTDEDKQDPDAGLKH
ncbi:hypothetical protein MSAN_02030800 [Mycena sanguinolenta]|uniref:DUF6534 domain-containing protein n=1 Tax=Mycena sanguinolenta TaxID=230812 RepID=A0A8H6XK24_9AGAR|nr:hypothetical protein MSAN_02030800 [Mycena sanguinolenta]